MTVFVINDVFLNGLTNPLHHTAMHLAFGEHRVDKVAKIVDDGIAFDNNDTGFGVNHHLGYMCAVGIAPPRQGRAFMMDQQVIATLCTRHLGDFQHRRGHVRAFGTEAFVIKADLGGRHAHFIGQEGCERVCHLGNRRQCRRALRRNRARSPRAAALGDQIAVALDDIDQVSRNAGLVRQELRINRLVALPVRLGPHINKDGAIFVELDLGALGWVAQNAFDIIAKALPPQQSLLGVRSFARCETVVICLNRRTRQ